jgi:hypothetical protein
MTAGHTPGPWRVGFSDGSGPDHVTTAATDADGLGPLIAAVRWGCDCCKRTGELTETERANARLIASAPALLAALEAADADLSEAVSYIPADGSRDRDLRERIEDTRKAARAAIAAARGEK